MTLDIAERLSPILSPWLEALLAHEKAIMPQSAAMRARAFQRASALLAAGQTVPLTRPSWSGWNRWRFGSVAGFGLLTSVAFLHMAGSHSATPTVISLPFAAPGSQLASPLAGVRKPSPPTLPKPDPEGATSGKASATPSPTTEERAQHPETDARGLAELEMLERAHRSDARGDFLAVLALAAEHERRYPTGRLCEEREVLRLRALIGLKRGHEARRVEQKFRHDYPHSVLLPTLTEMLAADL
jgi:hypothetical protein